MMGEFLSFSQVQVNTCRIFGDPLIELIVMNYEFLLYNFMNFLLYKLYVLFFFTLFANVIRYSLLLAGYLLQENFSPI